MILKIIIIAIICIFLSSTLKRHNQEFSSLVNVCGGVMIFLLCIDGLQGLMVGFGEFYNLINLKFDFLSPLLKVLGVGYATEFTADIAEDFGNSVIASKVLLGGKIVICGMSLQVIEKLLSVLLLLLS